MITAETFQRLEPISKTDRLLPVGGGDEFKAPLLKDWPKKPGPSIQQLKSWRRLRSIGIAMDHLVCIDVDGITAVERLLTLNLLEPELINTWRIDRDNDRHRFKLIWRPTPEQLRLLPAEITGNRRFWVIPTGLTQGEHLDLDLVRRDRDRIWKAAHLAYEAGRLPMLSPEHEAESKRRNSSFMMENIFTEPLRK